MLIITLRTTLIVLALIATACHESVDNRSDLSSYQNEPTEPRPSIPTASPADPATNTTTQPWVRPQSWHSDAVTPPPEYYQAIMKLLRERSASQTTEFNLADESTGDGAAVLYVDFDGEDLTYGFDEGESFILCEEEVTIPAPDLSLIEQTEILAEVQRYFDEANVLLEVTPIRPTVGDYTTVYVTGAIDDLGCDEDDGVLGIAPVDRGNNNPNDIGFAFTANLDPAQDDLIYMTSVVIAHEAGHSYGLNHNDNDHAIMYASVQPQVLGFDVGYARKFLFKTKQDSPKELREVLGVADPDLLPEEEDKGFKGSWCDQLANVRGFVLANFDSIDTDSNWLQTPSYCD